MQSSLFYSICSSFSQPATKLTNSSEHIVKVSSTNLMPSSIHLAYFLNMTLYKLLSTLVSFLVCSFGYWFSINTVVTWERFAHLLYDPRYAPFTWILNYSQTAASGTDMSRTFLIYLSTGLSMWSVMIYNPELQTEKQFQALLKLTQFW